VELDAIAPRLTKERHRVPRVHGPIPVRALEVIGKAPDQEPARRVVAVVRRHVARRFLGEDRHQPCGVFCRRPLLALAGRDSQHIRVQHVVLCVNRRPMHCHEREQPKRAPAGVLEAQHRRGAVDGFAGLPPTRRDRLGVARPGIGRTLKAHGLDPRDFARGEEHAAGHAALHRQADRVGDAAREAPHQRRREPFVWRLD